MTTLSRAQTSPAPSPGEHPVLQLHDVHVRYRIAGRRLIAKDTVHALTGVSLQVSAGETLGVVGESGCGKSTLAKAIVGLQRPSEGQVVFNGRSLWEMSAADRRAEFGRQVGMIFQDPSTALNRRLSVRSILRDPLDVHGEGSSSAREERVRELMHLVGLPRSAADALPGQLSGGQRQRVAIGRALALGPSLLVADEPTSALDVSVRAQVLNLLLRLQREMNLAMVFISHDIETVRRMSDRIITMYLGRVVEDLPSQQTVQGARHPYTAALMSATPSILHATTPIALSGPVPSAVRPPSGCAFHPRCWRASAECAEKLPELRAPESIGHSFACFHPVRGMEGAPLGLDTSTEAPTEQGNVPDLATDRADTEHTVPLDEREVTPPGVSLSTDRPLD